MVKTLLKISKSIYEGNKMARNVLVVDNSRIDRKLLSEILSEIYNVKLAENGRDALEILKQEASPFSAILVDLMMPVMDGFELIRLIRANHDWDSIPIIVISGLGDANALEEVMLAGANSFIVKPYRQSYLLSVIKNNIKLCDASGHASSKEHDKLTGIYNREAFLLEAREMIDHNEPGYYLMSCFDVKNFKAINEQYGPDKGDEVLKHIAKCLKECVNEIKGICCRFTCDRFAILYPIKYKDSEIIKRNHEETINPECIGRTIRIRIGRYVVNDLTLSTSAMYDRATMAGESIKGKYDVYIADYHEVMLEKILREQRIVNEMAEALKLNQFEPWFQPLYNHANGKQIGAEVLVRWIHPQKGIVMPGVFIPLFESNGFIYELDKFIWNETCKIIRKWLDEGKSPLPVSVNVSRYDLFQDDFYLYITSLIEKYQIPNELLRLEITESSFSKSTDQIIEVVKKLRAFGFDIEIDDFGSGYSSLNILKDVQANIIKLDMRFLESNQNSQRGGRILESIIRMAKWLDMPVIAEGVETKNQADYLMSLGCIYIQGYLYARPMPLAEYEELPIVYEKDNSNYLESNPYLGADVFWNPDSIETMVFNHFSGGACIIEYCNGHFEMLRVNHEYANTFRTKLTEQEILKLEPLSNLRNEEQQLIVDKIMKALLNNENAIFEVYSTLYSKKGRGEYVRFNAKLVSSNNDRYLFYCYLENITAQKLAEISNQQMSRQLQAIMNNINGGVSVTTFENGRLKYIYANEQFYNYLGYKKEHLKERLDSELFYIHPDDYSWVNKKIITMWHDKDKGILEYRIIHPDGSTRWVRCSVSVTIFPDVEGPVLLVISNDITKEKAISVNE